MWCSTVSMEAPCSCPSAWRGPVVMTTETRGSLIAINWNWNLSNGLSKSYTTPPLDNRNLWDAILCSWSNYNYSPWYFEPKNDLIATNRPEYGFNKLSVPILCGGWMCGRRFSVSTFTASDTYSGCGVGVVTQLLLLAAVPEYDDWLVACTPVTLHWHTRSSSPEGVLTYKMHLDLDNPN